MHTNFQPWVDKTFFFQGRHYVTLRLLLSSFRVFSSLAMYIIHVFIEVARCISAHTAINIVVVIINECMVSFVSSRYMRVVNGSLMVCLACSNRKTKCQNYRKISRN